MATTITLVGDSVFDNARYAAPGPSLQQQVARSLPGWCVEKRAVDGATTREILDTQLSREPAGRGAMVLSAGGNDALNSIHLLGADGPVSSGELWDAAHDVRARFRQDYSSLLEKACSCARPVAACTIYNPTFHRTVDGIGLQKIAECGLAFFNDIIVQEAMRRRLDIIDLRDICRSVEDFANPIEPSSNGGQKIAESIAGWVKRQCLV